MLCKNCGKKINDNTTICPVCGRPTGTTIKSQPVRLQQAHKISSMANSNPAPNRFAALMSTNKKRNMIIAAIVILLVVIITILIISSRSESNKFQHKTSEIIGKWDLYASTNNKGEMEDESDITFEFTDDGRIIITENNKAEIGTYIIEENVIYTRRGDYTKDFGIKKLDDSDLVLYKLSAPEFEYYFNRR